MPTDERNEAYQTRTCKEAQRALQRGLILGQKYDVPKPKAKPQSRRDTTSNFMIERGIPVSRHGRTKGDPKSYPIARMQIGDSFGIVCDDRNHAEKVRGALFSYAMRFHPKKRIRTRYFINDEGLRELRCWLVEGKPKSRKKGGYTDDSN